jgi:hypothetical protein
LTGRREDGMLAGRPNVSRRFRRVLLGILLAAAVVASLACDMWTFLPPLPTAEPLGDFGLPVAPTFPAFGEAWSQGPVGLGQALTVGAVDVAANAFLRPADSLVIHADSYPLAEPTEQYAKVDVSVTCRAPNGESCTVTESNFGLQSDSGKTYFPEFAMSFDGVYGLFEGGQMASGESQSGGVIFVVDRDATGLTLRFSSFPGGPGAQALFTLEP